MSKREEIREGMIEILKDGMANDTPFGETVDAIMRKQDSQGVVIKVDRELPHPWRDSCMSAHSEACKTCDNCEILEWAQFDLIEAGYVAVENLIDS